MNIEDLYHEIKNLSKKIDNIKIQKTFLTVSESAKYLSISESKLRKLIFDGKAPFNRIDGKIIFHKRKLDLWVLSNTQKTVFNKLDSKHLEVLE